MKISHYVKNPFLTTKKKQLIYGFFDFFHRFSRLFYRKKYFQKEIPILKNILLCNQAAFGDIFLSSFLIPVLKRAYPNCQIDFLISSKSYSALKYCPGIARTLTMDLVYQSDDAVLKKIINFLYFQLFKNPKMVRKLIKHRYDCVFNLCPSFSDMAPLFLKAKIPFRIGFNTAGYSRLFSHSLNWKHGYYLLDHYLKILQLIGIEKKHDAHFRSPMICSVEEKFLNHSLEKRCILFHSQSGYYKKDLPIFFWRNLLDKFKDLRQKIYFTGNGDAQKKFIDQITPNKSQNLCSKLSFQELIQVIARSSLVISVDTVVIHLAAAMQKPFIVFYQCTTDPDLWRPKSENGIAFIKKDPKLFEKILRKDERLIWVDEFHPDQVYKMAKKLLS